MNTEARLDDLECKIAYSDDLLDTLNRTIFRQQQQIDQLAAEIVKLRDQLRQQLPEETRNLREEIPPHY